MVQQSAHRFEDIEVSPGPDVYLYLTTDASEPNDVDAEGSLRVELDDSERGTFSFTGTFTQTTLPVGFVSPDEVSLGSSSQIPTTAVPTVPSVHLLSQDRQVLVRLYCRMPMHPPNANFLSRLAYPPPPSRAALCCAPSPSSLLHSYTARNADLSFSQYVAAVVWCDDFSVFFGSGLFEDVESATTA